MELLARAIATDPATHPDDLSMEMVAALRQAWAEGIAFVDVVRIVGDEGIELYLIATEAPEQDEQAGPLETLLAELAARIGMTKGVSFEVENRVIARNRRKGAAMQPHPFKAARWSTRKGIARCLTCGAGQPAEGACAGLGYAKAADTYSPPKGAQAAAARALRWIADGQAGDGFTDTGRARAAQLARGDSVSEETVRRMASFFARHEVDRRATGFNNGEPGYPSPGRVAWDAWGGDEGKSWSQRLVADMEKGDPDVGSVHVDSIMGGGRRSRRKPPGFISQDPKRLPSDNTGASMAKAEGEYEPMLNERQQAMRDAYELIVDAFGLFDWSSGADGAHYMPAAANPFAERGLACANCVFYDGGGGCDVVAGQVEPNGVCKLWVIEESLVTEAAMALAKARADGTPVGISKADGTQRYTMGPMYVPDTLDAHDEWTDADSLQHAVWEYVRAGDRRIRLQHNRDVVAGEWVECMAWPYEITVPMQQPDGNSVPMTFPANTVFLGVVWEPWAWELVKAGKLRGFSMGGRAERVMADLPTTTGGMA